MAGWRPAVIPPRGWCRWLTCGSQLSARHPTLPTLVIAIASVWVLAASLVAVAIQPLFPFSVFYVMWILTVVGSFHALCGGINLARAADESRSISDAIAIAFDPRMALRALRSGYVHLLVLVTLGVGAHRYLGFDLVTIPIHELRDAALRILDADHVPQTTVVVRSVRTLLAGIGATLLPAIAGLQVAFTTCLGITVPASAIDGGSTGPFQGIWRSFVASRSNFVSAGTIGWVLAPGIGVGLLLSRGYWPVSTFAGLLQLACLAAILWFLPSLMYVANREMCNGIFSNLPKGFLPTHGALIDNDGAQSHRG